MTIIIINYYYRDHNTQYLYVLTVLPDSEDFKFGLEVSDFWVSCIGGGFLGGYLIHAI